MVSNTPVWGRILVVDDDPMHRRFLGGFLRGRASSAVAGNGQEALAQVAARPPDLVLLDLGMPGVSGMEVCRPLKADPATRLIPVLVLTGEDPATGASRPGRPGPTST